jgi:hypothetical protein
LCLSGIDLRRRVFDVEIGSKTHRLPLAGQIEQLALSGQARLSDRLAQLRAAQVNVRARDITIERDENGALIFGRGPQVRVGRLDRAAHAAE